MPNPLKQINEKAREKAREILSASQGVENMQASASREAVASIQMENNASAVTRSDTLQIFKLESEGTRAASPSRKKIAHILHSFTAQIVLGGLIFGNLGMVVWQTNQSVVDEQLPFWGEAIDKSLLIVFIAELIARLYVMRWKFFGEALNLLDLFVILIDVVLEGFSLAGFDATLSAASFLRVARLARVARAYRVMLMVPKLAGMVRDLVGAMEAVLWGCLMLFMVMTVWSILTVQLIHPLVKDLADEGVFDGCDRCKRAYSSVMNANLTYFQTIIAGDSWGQVTIPIMEAYPWTSCLFVPVLISISLAIMNVILAVIVESAEETRRDDLVERMKIKEKLFMQKSKQLVRVCATLDQDGSGDLTYDELIRGFREHKELAMTLHDMGIGEDDLSTIFSIMDSDNSGTVDYKEFVHHIHKMRTADETTILNFIRHYVMEILHRVRDNKRELESNREIALQNQAKIESPVAGGLQMDANPLGAGNVEVRNGVKTEAHEFREMCNQMLARFDNDLLGALTDISRKCEAQTSMLADLSKSLPPVSNGFAPVRVAPMPNQAFTPPKPELLEDGLNGPAPAYACVLSNCTLERHQRPRPPKMQPWPSGQHDVELPASAV